MLEQELQNLTNEIKALREQLATIARDVAFYRPEAEKAPQQVRVPWDVRPEETTQALPEEPKREPAPITRADVQARCLEIVRANPANKQKLSEIVKGFGGAEVLRQVKDADLPALMAKLEDLG